MKQVKNHPPNSIPKVAVKNVKPAMPDKRKLNKATSSEVKFFEAPIRRRYSFDDNGGGYMGL